MEAPSPGLDKKTLSELRVVGFVNAMVAHLHLFKHVLRFCGLPPDELHSSLDSERWSEVIPNPPLASDLHARRRRARERLAAIPSCGLQTGRSHGDVACRTCSDAEAQGAVDGAFSDILAAYLQAGREAFEWAKENVCEKLPFLIAFCQNGQPDVRLKFMDNRKITAIGLLGRSDRDVLLLTCYRRDPESTLSVLRLSFSRERAGHRNAGTLVPIHGA